MQGIHIQAYIDKDKVIEYFDNRMSNTLLQSGAIRPYTEDANVQFDDVYVSSLS